MRGFPHPWWVAGGWALDIFVGTGREHDDVDVLVRRGDQQWIRRQLPDWDVQIAHAGRLEPWPDGHDVDLPRSGFWARSDPDGPWQLQFLLGEHEADEWWYRRDRSIRMPLGEIGHVSASGIPYLRPEIVLLYKSRLDRPRDAEDFERTLPKLDDDARKRLASWLPPDHVWRASLSTERAAGSS
jgi:hypothetical protein